MKKYVIPAAVSKSTVIPGEAFRVDQESRQWIVHERGVQTIKGIAAANLRRAAQAMAAACFAMTEKFKVPDHAVRNDSLF